MPRKSPARTDQTRREILAKAVDLASVEGLEGVTIGRLADAISMSKSGLFAHFGSKEELQVAVVEAAREVFVREVLDGAVGAEGGLAGLAGLAFAWLGYVEKGLFRGGCFFAAVSAEVDDRPGKVRDRVIELTRGWMDVLEEGAEAAVAEGQLRDTLDTGQLAFELHAFIQEANWSFQLHGDAASFRRAARAIDRALRSEATQAGLAVLDAVGERP